MEEQQRSTGPLADAADHGQQCSPEGCLPHPTLPAAGMFPAITAACLLSATHPSLCACENSHLARRCSMPCYKRDLILLLENVRFPVRHPGNAACAGGLP